MWRISVSYKTVDMRLSEESGGGGGGLKADWEEVAGW